MTVSVRKAKPMTNSNTTPSTMMRVIRWLWERRPSALVHRQQRRPAAAPRAEESHGEQPEDDAADVGEVAGQLAGGAGAGEAREVDVELLGQPQRDQQHGGDVDEREHEWDRGERDHLRARVQQQVAAEHGGDCAGAAEHGNAGARLDSDLDAEREQPAEQVEGGEAHAPGGVFDGGTEQGEEGHVAEEVQEAAIHEQRGDRGFPPREAAGVGEHVGRRAVVPGDLDAGSAEEAAAVADLEHVGEHVEPDQENGDQREPRERNVVFDGEHRCGPERDGPRQSLGVRGERLVTGQRPDTGAALRDMLVSVVGGAHERAGGDGLEAKLVGGGLQRGELVGVPVTHDGQMALGGTQVLPGGGHLHAVLAQRAEGVEHLLVGLAESDHQPGLGDDLAFAHFTSKLKNAAGALDLRAAPGDGVQPRHDLDVVVEDVGALDDDLGERHLLALEVGREHLDLTAWRLLADLADDADERGGALVGQVVAVDGGDDCVAQAHARDRACNAGGLERVVPGGLAGLYVAEAAAPGAGVAEDHERGGAALPALADVGAGGLLADGVQVLVANQLRELAVALPTGRGHLEPGRLALAQRSHVGAEHGEHVHAAGVGTRSRSAHAGTASAMPGGLVLRGARSARLDGFVVSIPSRCGETRRWRRPCAWAKLCAMRLRKHASSGSHAVAPALPATPAWECPPLISRASEVMVTSGRPQATTQEKGSRSLWTLTAKPCVVTPRATCTPMDAILRSCTHTPV